MTKLHNVRLCVFVDGEMTDAVEWTRGRYASGSGMTVRRWKARFTRWHAHLGKVTFIVTKHPASASV